MYKLDVNDAKSADNISTAIRESGKYVGWITRAEKLNSQSGTGGLGLSFKTTGGQTADYLDIYTHKSGGEKLMGAKTVSAIMACLKLRELPDGLIEFERWDKDAGARIKVQADGFPLLMQKKIGLLLQKEVGTHSVTGKETERMVVFGVFQADSELTASEILEQKIKPEKLSKMVEALAARPVRDNRKTAPARKPATAADGGTSASFDDMDNDIPF